MSTVAIQDAYWRFARWCDNGIWELVHQHFADEPDMECLTLDSTVVRAHPCAAGALHTSGDENVSERVPMCPFPCVRLCWPDAFLAENVRPFEHPSLKMDNPFGLLGLIGKFPGG